VVLVVAVSAAGLGGTFATWSDSETSGNNTVVTGSLDLKVNMSDDEPWGWGVPRIIDVECVVPCKLYGPYDVELWNAGQCEYASKAFMRVKEVVCSNVDPKINPRTNTTTGYPDPMSGDLKPEPELVAEWGGPAPDGPDSMGKVDCTWVDGVGVWGDNCTLGNFTYVWVTEPGYPLVVPEIDPLTPWSPWQLPDLSIDDPAIYGQGYLAGFDPIIDLMYLCPCQPQTVSIWFKVVQTPEEYFGEDYFTPDPWDDELTQGEMMHWAKFNDWPSWSLMKDKMEFSVEFDLWLNLDDPNMPICGQVT
jgi:predicted ribosomally synthesized peptide with SipW-like signal peptide